MLTGYDKKLIWNSYTSMIIHCSRSTILVIFTGDVQVIFLKRIRLCHGICGYFPSVFVCGGPMCICMYHTQRVSIKWFYQVTRSTMIHFQFVGSYSSLLALCKTFTMYTSGDTTSCYNWSPGRLGQTSDNLPSDTIISDPVLTTQFGLVSVYTDSNSYTRGLLRIPFDNALLIIRRLFTFVEQLCTTWEHW